MGNASCVREGSIKLACSPPHHRTWICPPQRCILRCPLLTISVANFPSTISLHLWPTLHSQACTNLHLPSIRHNELRDMMAGFLTEVCHNVGIEPPLQPLTGEHLTLRSANKEDGARLDIAADNFWGRDRNYAIYDIRVFSPFAQSHQNAFLSQCYKKKEQEKKGAYDQLVREMEHGVFSMSGGIGPTANMVYKRMIAQKHDQTYSKTLHCIRCKLSYSLLRSAIMCLRGARSSIYRPTTSPQWT